MVAWASSVAAADLYMSVISFHELEIGVLFAERSDPSPGALLRTWLDERVLTAFAEHLFPVDVTVALRSASLHVPDPRPVHDALIAATALVHDMIVMTRNDADFEPTCVALHDPWSAP